MREVNRESSIADYVEMEVIWDRLWVTSSRPYGTFRLLNLYPGLRPGLSSAVPAGLILQSVSSHADSKALMKARFTAKTTSLKISGHDNKGSAGGTICT